MADAAASIESLIARWDSNEGKPYKGKLIDWSAYGGDGTDAPTDIGCMCAQGQAFFFLPMFGFADPEAIPARPANYGQVA